MSLRAESDNAVFQLWDGVYDDIERCIVAFFSLEDLKNLFTISKKFNKMMTKRVSNVKSVESLVILPAIKQAMTVQYFENEREKLAHTQDEAIKKLQIEKEKKTVGYMKSIVSKSVTVSKWFFGYLIDNANYLECFLFIETPATRRVFSQLIITCLRTVKPFELNKFKQLNMKYRLKNSDKNEQDDTIDEMKKQNLNDINKRENVNNTSIKINQVLS